MKRWQAKDIPEELVLDLIDAHDLNAQPLAPVGHLLSEWYPWKVVAVKLRKMEERGLIERYGWGPLYGLIKRREQ